MYSLQISDDTIDSLFNDKLIQDYRNLVNDINIMDSRIARGDMLQAFEQADLENWLTTLAAMDVLLGYYLTDDDANAIRSES